MLGTRPFPKENKLISWQVSFLFSQKTLKQLFWFIQAWYKSCKMLCILPWFKSYVDLKITEQYFMWYQVACSKVTQIHIFKLILISHWLCISGASLVSIILLPWCILIPIQSEILTISRLWMTGCHAFPFCFWLEVLNQFSKVPYIFITVDFCLH